MIKRLITKGANVNVANNLGITPLMAAALDAPVTLLQFLLDNGADPDARDSQGLGVSHYAVQQFSLLPLHFLMMRDVFNANATDYKGNTPLHLALDKEGLDIAFELINEEPRLATVPNENGETALHLCALQGSKQPQRNPWSSDLKFASRALELNGNVVLQSKNRDGLNPVELAESREKPTESKRASKWKTDFGRFFGPFMSGGNYIQHCQRRVMMKKLLVLFWFSAFFGISTGIDHRSGYNEVLKLCQPLFSPLDGLTYRFVLSIAIGVFMILLIFWLINGEPNRIGHPSGRPNPSQIGFVYGTVFISLLSLLSRLVIRLALNEYSCIIELIISLLLMIPLVVVLYKVIRTESDHIPKASSFDVIDDIVSGKNTNLYCPAIRQTLPYQTKYCKMINRAVRGFDHHCLFLQQTIGHGTHHYFIMFLILMVINQAWYATCIIRLAVIDATFPNGIELAMCIFCLGGIWNLSGMACQQVTSIKTCGTQFFRGNEPASYRNICQFFFRHRKYCTRMQNRGITTV